MNLTTPTKATKDCFKGFSYRDSDFDNWLPKVQPAQSGDITIKQNQKEMTFLEMAQEYLGTTDVEEIKKHTLTLPMVEELVKNHESELRTDGCANFFFVEDNKEGVSVGYVFRGGRAWRARVNSLGLGSRWGAGDRFLLRDLEEASTLRPSDPVLGLDAAIKMVKDAGYVIYKPV